MLSSIARRSVNQSRRSVASSLGSPRLQFKRAFSLRDRNSLTDASSADIRESGKGEIDVVEIPLLTTDHHPHGRITKVHGVVSASSVRNKNILIDAFIALKGIFGGHAVHYEDLINECYVSAANGLAEAASSVGKLSHMVYFFN